MRAPPAPPTASAWLRFRLARAEAERLGRDLRVLLNNGGGRRARREALRAAHTAALDEVDRVLPELEG